MSSEPFTKDQALFLTILIIFGDVVLGIIAGELNEIKKLLRRRQERER